MSTGTVFLINDGLVLLLWLFTLRYLSSYMSEKGKNLATKEDVEEITRKVEAVRSQFEAQSDIRKSELNRMVDVHRIQFELEFSVLRELWAKINDVLKEAHWLALASAQRPGSGIDKAQEKLEQFIVALQACDEVNTLNKPFVHKEVYGEVSSLMQLLSGLYNTATQKQARNDPNEYWAEANKGRDKILQSVERICEKIRQRAFPEKPPQP
jgi:hypothetical protein